MLVRTSFVLAVAWRRDPSGTSESCVHAGFPTPNRRPGARHAKALALRAGLRRQHPDIYAWLYGGGPPEPSGFGSLTPRQTAEVQALCGPIRWPSCPAVGFLAPRARGGAPRRSSQAPSAWTTSERAATVGARNDSSLRRPGPHRFQTDPDGGATGGAARSRLHRTPRRHQLRQPLRDRNQHPRHPGFQEGCGGTFGPTQRDLRAGQQAHYTKFMNARCHGRTRVSVTYVTVSDPALRCPYQACLGRAPRSPSCARR